MVAMTYEEWIAEIESLLRQGYTYAVKQAHEKLQSETMLKSTEKTKNYIATMRELYDVQP